MEENAEFENIPEKQIEDLYSEGVKPEEAVNMHDRVLDMPPKELIEQYRRVNGEMLDENGLNIDEQEEKFRQAYFAEHGIKGFGQASSDWLKKAADKYTFNKMALRWDLLERIKELGLFLSPHTVMRTESSASIPPSRLATSLLSLEWMS